ncbi:hypothetical protein Esti_006489 [Eimeria stiedai]
MRLTAAEAVDLLWAAAAGGHMAAAETLLTETLPVCLSSWDSLRGDRPRCLALYQSLCLLAAAASAAAAEAMALLAAHTTLSLPQQQLHHLQHLQKQQQQEEYCDEGAGDEQQQQQLPLPRPAAAAAQPFRLTTGSPPPLPQQQQQLAAEAAAAADAAAEARDESHKAMPIAAAAAAAANTSVAATDPLALTAAGKGVAPTTAGAAATAAAEPPAVEAEARAAEAARASARGLKAGAAAAGATAAAAATAAGEDPLGLLLLRRPVLDGFEAAQHAASSSALADLQTGGLIIILSNTSIATKLCLSFERLLSLLPVACFFRSAAAAAAASAAGKPAAGGGAPWALLPDAPSSSGSSSSRSSRLLECLSSGGFSLFPTAGAEETVDWGSEALGVGVLLLQEEGDICVSPLLLLQRRLETLCASLCRRSSRLMQQQQQHLLLQLQQLQQTMQQHQQLHQLQQQHFRLNPHAALRLRLLKELMGWRVVCLNATRAAALLQPEAEPLLLQRVAAAAREAPMPAPLAAAASAAAAGGADAFWGETAEETERLRALAAAQLQRELSIVLGVPRSKRRRRSVQRLKRGPGATAHVSCLRVACRLMMVLLSGVSSPSSFLSENFLFASRRGDSNDAEGSKHSTE